VKSGFVAVVGRPNVGKSTLVNALVGSKVSITSSRPQTTRNAIRGVVTLGLPEPHSQIVLVDTPGLHKPRNALGERLNSLVYGTLAEVDAIVFVLDAAQKVGPGDRLIAERLAQVDTEVIVVVNKVDRSKPDQIAERLAEASLWDFAAYVPISALTGDGTERVLSELLERMPEGPMYFPPEAVSDQPEELLVAEIIREKFLDRLRDELPHSLTVRTRDIEVRDDGLMHIDAQVVVERESQKGIVIGKGAAVLKAAGAEARQELEALFGTKVFLDLRVAVEKDWQRRPQLLDRLGF
jgi:GTP-binding protein Era